MKRNVLLYLLLLIAETLFASEDNNTLMLRQKPTKELPIPLVIGNKAISQKKLLALSDEQQKKLNETGFTKLLANPCSVRTTKDFITCFSVLCL